MTQAPFTYFTKDHAVSMSLRDYFAAKALVGLIDAALVANDERGISKDDVCIYCYEWADAMLTARETK